MVFFSITVDNCTFQPLGYSDLPHHLIKPCDKHTAHLGLQRHLPNYIFYLCQAMAW